MQYNNKFIWYSVISISKNIACISAVGKCQNILSCRELNVNKIWAERLNLTRLPCSIHIWAMHFEEIKYTVKRKNGNWKTAEKMTENFNKNDLEEIQRFQEYLRIPTIQINGQEVDYSKWNTFDWCRSQNYRFNTSRLRRVSEATSRQIGLALYRLHAVLAN